MSKTKIVATIGPATANREKLLALFDAGMDVARLNGSHADLAWHGETIKLIRATVPSVPILLDIPGRKVRTGQLARDLSFKSGDTITLTTDPNDKNPDRAVVNHPVLHKQVGNGTVLLADDGTLRFTVVGVNGHELACRAEVDGILRSHKGINVPGAVYGIELVTDRDRDMVEFARNCGVDFVGISFVESSAHVDAVRDLCGQGGPRIVSKVENQRGLDNVVEIVNASDGLMIDRGDLSVETNMESVAVFQKKILGLAAKAGKPVIVATEMLHTMIENPYPTKAEISDITNAVLDGCAATMLSGETAVGRHSIESVKTMRRVADVASRHLQATLDDTLPIRGTEDIPQAVEDAIALICRRLAVTKIVAVTLSGYAARMIAARRPRQPILAVTNDPATARSLNLLAGTEGIFVDVEFSRTSTDHIIECLRRLWMDRRLVDDDLVLVTAVAYPKTGRLMNLIQTHKVVDLVETLDWQRPAEVR